MSDQLVREIERLTANATRRREDLLRTGLRKSARRKALTVGAGVLALTSAGTVTAVIAKAFGSSGVQLVAALTAAVSGTISLLVAAYYGDDAVLTMLTGSAKYLALRENVYRLVIEPNISDADRFKRLTDFQGEYASLDELYSRFFSPRWAASSQSPPPGSRAERKHAMAIEQAANAEYDKVRRLLEISQEAPEM